MTRDRRTPPSALARLRGELMPFVNLALFALALVSVDHVLTEYPGDAVTDALRRIPLPLVGIAFLTTILGYFALVLQDLVGFRILGKPFSLRDVLVPSFISSAVSASAPGSMLTGGGARYRLYRGMGVSAGEAAVLALIVAVTWVLGLLVLAGVLLVWRPLPGVLGTHLPESAGRAVGALFLAIVAAYLIFTARSRGARRIGRFSLGAPTLRLALAQLGASLADWLLACGTLYILLSSVERISFPSLLAAFCVAQTGGLVLPVPGGLGVFEAVVLLLRPKGTAGPSVLAALLAYRVIYYLLPLLAAGALALRRELARGEGGLGRRVGEALVRLAPHLLAGLTFVSGGLLFLTGAIPREEARVAWMTRLLPAALIDVSQFLASVVGAMLLVLAWALERRVQLAYRAVVLLFGWGILLSLTRSMDLTLAVGLAVVLTVMMLAGRAFPQPVTGLEERMGAGWAFAVGAVLVTSIWLGVVSRRWSQALGETWWRFTLFGSAPAYVRAAVGAGVALLLMTMVRVLQRNRPRRKEAGSAG